MASRVFRVLALMLVLLPPAAVAQPAAPPACAHRPAAADALARLTRAMAHGRFAAYQPTSLRVVAGRVQSADPQSIRADLTVLRPRFDALVTYDAVHGAEAIPDVAAALGFHTLIIGVWDPTDPAQLQAAIAAARRHPQLVVALSLGNETLFAHRASATAIAAAIVAARAQAPRLALSTTEPFHIFEEPVAAGLLAELDFLLPNVHPVFQPWFRGASDATSAQFVVNVVTDLAQHFCGPILVKETGIPTAPAIAGYTPERQAAFYAELRQRLPASAVRAFAYFSAFDAPWRAGDAGVLPGVAAGPEEAWWGLYDSARQPKSAALALPPL